jgi:IclR family transcriptional regulator, KDG regulon repressor
VNETQDTAAAKMLAILEALSQAGQEGGQGSTVSALARALGRDKSSISRQLKPLVDLGLVERDDDGLHRLGWKLFAVAAQAGDQRLLLLAPPVIRHLTRLLKERVHLSVRRNDEVFTILSEGPQRAIEAVGWVGRTAPITCTSSGRALLFDHSAEEIRDLIEDTFRPGPGPKAPATVEEVIERVRLARAQGFALVVDEFEDGLSAVAAPVRDVHGRIVAAINMSAPSYRLNNNLHNAGRQVSQAALYLSRSLSSPPAETPSISKENPHAQTGSSDEVRRVS